MTLRCQIDRCPWNSSGKFCKKDFVFITQRGQCDWIFDRMGRVKPNWNVLQQEKGNEKT